MLLNILKHVNYNLLRVLRMDKSYLTGLKLKNNLSSELVSFYPIYRKSLCLQTAKMFSGTHVVPLYTRIVIWDMQEIISLMI